MRLLFALLACTTPAALFADVIEARSKVTRVTIFPYGAQVEREISVKAPAGSHELRVADLPLSTDAASLRVSGEGVSFGGVVLAVGRQAATAEPRPEVLAARDAVVAAEQALAEAEAKVAAIRAQSRAAEAEVAFLRGQRVEGSAEEILAMAKLVGEQALAASRRAIAAEVEAKAAEAGLKPAQEALAEAEQALAAVENPAETATLSATVSGSGTLKVTSFVEAASWQPAYDVSLDRGEKSLEIKRSVLVSQASGEDWRGVDLVLSTARPSEQATPSALWPRRLSASEQMPMPMAAAKAEMMAADAASAERMVSAPAPQMAMETQGQTVVYTYPTQVELRDGVENLRLALDTLTLPAEVQAEAVPLLDATAYLTATAKNTGEILLPGQAMLFESGALKGASAVPLTVTGGEIKLGFGAIDGLRLKRLQPETMQGGRGFINKSNALREVTLLSVENLTQEAWPMRVLERLPYSEQEDLTIATEATPAPSETDIDDMRGVSAWEFELKAGETQEIKIESEITWPEGKELSE